MRKIGKRPWKSKSGAILVRFSILIWVDRTPKPSNYSGQVIGFPGFISKAMFVFNRESDCVHLTVCYKDKKKKERIMNTTVNPSKGPTFQRGSQRNPREIQDFFFVS